MRTALLVGQASLLDDDLVEAQLDLGALNHLFLDRLFGDEAEDAHLLLLANAMGAVLRLQVHLRVPIEGESASRINNKPQIYKCETIIGKTPTQNCSRETYQSES